MNLASQVILSVVELPAYIYAVISRLPQSKYFTRKYIGTVIVWITFLVLSRYCQMLLIDLWGRKPVFSLSLTFTGIALIVSAFIEVVQFLLIFLKSYFSNHISQDISCHIFSLFHLHRSCTHCVRFYWGSDISQTSLIFIVIIHFHEQSCVMCKCKWFSR